MASSFCRTCGHAASAHVAGGGPCTWRGPAPFEACRCNALAGEEEVLEPAAPIDRERFLADAARAFRICYPERWDALVRAVEKGWPARQPEGDTGGFQQISIEAQEDEEGIQQVEIDAEGDDGAAAENFDDTKPIRFRRTAADEFLDRVGEAIAVKNWQAAFDNLREAMNVEGAQHAESWLRRVYCPVCARQIEQPSPAHSTADYARFWRGRCPECQNLLVIR